MSCRLHELYDLETNCKNGVQLGIYTACTQENIVGYMSLDAFSTIRVPVETSSCHFFSSDCNKIGI